MTIIVYIYSDPLLECPPDQAIWGFEVDRIYQDLGQRQQLKQLLADCQKQPAKYLLIRRLDELGDSLEEINNHLTHLESLGIQIIAIKQSYSTPKINQQNTDKIKNYFGQLLAEISKNQFSHRLRQGHARNRLKALPPPGKAPYGYRRGQDKYIIDRSTAPVVKDFFERFLLFGSLRGAVRYLEKRYGKKISPSTGRKWLTNPTYRGDLVYQNAEVIANTHTPIISREEAAQIDRLLRRNSRLPTRTASAPRSLAGLVMCEKCNSLMTISHVTTHNRTREYLYLRPLNCPLKPKCKAISYQAVLQQTIERICEDLPRAVAQLNIPSSDKIRNSLRDKIKEKQSIIDQLPSLKAAGILDEETAALRNYKLRTEIAKLEDKLSQLPPVNLQNIAQTIFIPQFWLDLSESERRFYFREFIQQIKLIKHSQKKIELQLVFIF